MRWRCRSCDDRRAQCCEGRKLAVSFHVVGESGPMTWHAKALQTPTSRRPAPARTGKDESESAFPFSHDLLVLPRRGRHELAGEGPGHRGLRRFDHRRHRHHHQRRRPLAGRAVAPPARAPMATPSSWSTRASAATGWSGPATITPPSRLRGGPGALARLDRDIVEPAGRHDRDLAGGHQRLRRGRRHASKPSSRATPRASAALRAEDPGRENLRRHADVGAQQHSATHGRAEVDAKRKALNEFLRASKIFDGVIDFDTATLDPATGEDEGRIRSPTASTGGPGDKLHPNRAGYAAMANAIDLGMITGRPNSLPAAGARGRPRQARGPARLFRSLGRGEKKRFSGRGRPRFSRRVLPSYSVRNMPRRCSSGTTRSTKSSSPPGR